MRNLGINFTRVTSVNPNVLQVYFFSNWFLFSLPLYWTFNPCPPCWKTALTLTAAASIRSINTSRSLSLHHLINSCRAAGASSLYLDTGRKWARNRRTGPVIICSLSEVSVATARETHPEAAEPTDRRTASEARSPARTHPCSVLSLQFKLSFPFGKCTAPDN